MTKKKGKGNPNPKRKFQKGNKFGKGPPRLPAELRGIKEVPLTYFRKAIHKFLQMKIEDIQQMTNKPEFTNKLTALEGVVLRSLSLALMQGDLQHFDYLMKNAFGADYKTNPLESDDKEDELKKTVADFLDKRREMIENKSDE